MKARPKNSLAKIIQAIPGYDPVATAGDCTFDEQTARRALDFFSACITHVKGELAGKPFNLELWQQAIVANIFGWMTKNDKGEWVRRYKEVFVFVPRKNGKSTLAAGIVLLVMFVDDEPGAELYSAAADREQAMLVFDQAKGMVLNEPEFDKRVKIYAAAKSIVYESRGTSYKAISAEANTKHGYNTHLAVIDELHAQPNRELVDVLMTSTGARRQPLIVHITTSDFDRESICNEKLDYAQKVRDGIIEDESFLPVIYEASIDDDWRDEKVWERVNPNLDVSLSREYLRRECQRAIETPSFENTFKRLHLNIKTEQDVRWLPLELWDECERLELDQLQGRYGEERVLITKPKNCYAGLDLSGTNDTTSLVLAFPRDDGIDILPFFWIPRDNARAREKKDRVPYSQWAREGHLIMTEGNVVDYRFVRQRINELVNQYKIKVVAYDPWNAMQLAMQLQDEDGIKMEPHRQGFISMNEPSKELERLLMSGKIRHDHNPVMRWQVSNVAIKTDPAGNIKPVKPEHKDARKVDGVVAAVMAVGRATLQVQAGPSVYEERGLITL
jgi:phage terminase large subunit-like protein